MVTRCLGDTVFLQEAEGVAEAARYRHIESATTFAKDDKISSQKLRL